MSLPKAIIFIGPQGSGKGTQAKILVDKIHGKYIGTGELFRDMAKEDSDFGRHIKGIMDEGSLITEEDVKKMVVDSIAAVPLEMPVVVDGIPRNISQAKFFMDLVKTFSREPVATIYINLSREEAVHRMQLRNRADDNEETINKRLEIYYTETTPIIEYLKNNTDFHEIDGSKTIPEIAQNIRSALAID